MSGRDTSMMNSFVKTKSTSNLQASFQLKSVALRRFAVLAAMVASLIAPTAEAGRMKELHLLHLEAIAIHLYGNPDTDGLETRNTTFVKPEPGYFTGISSEVQVYSAVRNNVEWVKCTTMIEKTSYVGPSGAVSEDFVVTKTDCK